jgi:hypothetical protein
MSLQITIVIGMITLLSVISCSSPNPSRSVAVESKISRSPNDDSQSFSHKMRWHAAKEKY